MLWQQPRDRIALGHRAMDSGPGPETWAKIVSLGGTVVQEFNFINSGTYLVPGGALGQLESDPEVKYVTVDRAIRHKLDYSAAAVNASAAWNSGVIGFGVGVAVIDSGINSDPNLANIVYTQDFTGATGKKQELTNSDMGSMLRVSLPRQAPRLG